MARHRRASSAASNATGDSHDDQSLGGGGQEMASMYDYLAKIILLGPSGSGKSCLLHRFINNSWRSLTSQTIGVEFASKIVKVGTSPGHRKRIKLQLWDTAGTERFRSVSRSYYRGAAGAVLCYDISDPAALANLGEFLNDARALASPQLAVVLAGNKIDLADPTTQQSLLDDIPASVPSSTSMGSIGPTLGSQMRATISPVGRALPQVVVSNWATQHRIPAVMEVSALSGEGVDEVFNKLARTILTKIELGEIDPDDHLSGVQYGDADYYRYDDASSIKSSRTADAYSSSRSRRGRRKPGLSEWSDVFRIPGRRSNGCC
ncbi:ras-domain-containing protein [Polychaeton citri CBS 116435]|uniref:Ras-domain-containing protein n=1 Tax=Polychaeton citri CBS 116435 TaxID=1314669 RepID=A0A9P4Q374_9PEZI|nr:ras-domain-containing protein [Polychaeton citri CBS 116435]